MSVNKTITLITIILMTIVTFVGLWGNDTTSEVFPNLLNVCFSAEMIGNTVGNVEITSKDGIVVTPFEWFNELARQYEIISLKRRYWVKNQTWHDNGKYPMNIFQLELKDDKLTDELMKTLSAHKDVLFAEREAIIRPDYIPNDPRRNDQWALAKIQAYQAWDIEKGSPDIIVGIIDTGVKWNHIDLRDNMWINEPELVGMTINWTTGVITGGDCPGAHTHPANPPAGWFCPGDNDQNGKCDDPLGWDFIKEWREAPSGGLYIDAEGNNPFQNFTGNDHGTHVSGCAAATPDNNVGVAGPGFNVKLLNTKQTPYNNASFTSLYNTYAAMYYLVDTGVHIINCSFSSSGDASAEISNTAVNYANAHNVLVCASAGNGREGVGYDIDSGDPDDLRFPANATNAFTVAATQSNDVRTTFTNWGAVSVDISSPGNSILATTYNTAGVDGYGNKSGTSMASPIVAGVAGLILSRNPYLPVDSLKAILKRGADPIDAVNNAIVHGKLGAGRLNAYNSILLTPSPYQFDLRAISISGPDLLNFGEEGTFTVTVNNNGQDTVSGYSIELMRVGSDSTLATVAGTPLEPHQTASFNVNWTSNISGEHLFYAHISLAADSNQSNNSTTTIIVSILAPGAMQIYVGNQNSTQYNFGTPVNLNQRNSVSQTIYRQSDIGVFGVISRIELYIRRNGNQPSPTSLYTIYMATTSSPIFNTSSAWIPTANFTQVYHGTLPMSTAGDYAVPVTLDTTFTYRANNLVVMIHRHYDENIYGNTNTWLNTASPAQNRTLGLGTSTAFEISPAPPTGTDLVTRYANITFSINTTEGDLYLPPANLTATVNNGAIDLNWARPQFGDLSTLTGYKLTRNDSLLAITSERTFTDTTVTPDINYTYRVIAIYGDTESVPVSVSRYIPLYSPITHLQATLIDGAVKLTWNKPARQNYGVVTNYDIDRDGESLVTLTDTTFVDYTVPGDFEHTYTVRAFYQSLNGRSVPVETTIFVPRYSPPQHLHSIIGNLEITLLWETPAPQTHGTVMTYKIYKNTIELYTFADADTLNFTDTNVISGETYTYGVTAIYENPDGESNPAITQATAIEYIFNPPTNLQAEAIDRQVFLTWSPPETGYTGSMMGYTLFIDHNEHSTILTDTTFIHTELTDGQTYFYYLKAIYENPTGISTTTDTVSVTIAFVSENENQQPPLITGIKGNYPNPFNPNTTIQFEIRNAEYGMTNVSIDIYNIKGQRVRSLVEGVYGSGTYSVVWNGKDDNGQSVSSGLYFCRMRAGDVVETKRMLLLK